jgi:hypothetical protein
MLGYSIAPSVAGALVAFIALWAAHARGLHFAGLRTTGFSLVLPAGYGGAGRSGAIVRLALDSLLDDHALFRVAGGHASPRRLEGQGFFARPASFTCPTYLSIRKYSGLCLRWRLFASFESSSVRT